MTRLRFGANPASSGWKLGIAGRMRPFELDACSSDKDIK